MNFIKIQKCQNLFTLPTQLEIEKTKIIISMIFIFMFCLFFLVKNIFYNSHHNGFPHGFSF